MLNNVKTLREQGFTLVELLVVIVILLALAAIAIPVFLNQKANADEAATKATVTAIASFINAGIANGSIATSHFAVGPDNVQSTDNGSIAVPEGYKAKWAVPNGLFCVEGSQGSSGVFHYKSTEGTIQSGTCA